MTIRLVLFDAFHTILVPRRPIYVQYAQTFEPYLGAIDPDIIKSSFKTAYKQLRVSRPAYQDGAQDWWKQVIHKTAIGAGADPSVVDKSLNQIVSRLLERFSTKEGYRLFDDTIPCLQELKAMNIRAGLVSNTDIRMRSVLADLEVLPFLDFVMLSEEEGIEKPSQEIFRRACQRAGVRVNEALHVGDALVEDYEGAKATGLAALLLRRLGPKGEGEEKEEGEDLTSVPVVTDLLQVVEHVKRDNFS